MDLIQTILLALALAMDAFAVSLACSAVLPAGRRPAFRLAFHFGLFQALMPVLGWLAGLSLAGLLYAVDHWLAFGLLAWIGLRMLRAREKEVDEDRPDPTRGWTLLALSVAVSLDALAVGLSLAFLGVEIWQPVLVIGVVTGLLSWAGVRLGRRLGSAWGPRMERAGGIILILIGLRILATHLRW
ncbi:MAG: manganese efflux pump MntP family protein [bacterium]|nr:manganese efflux pump MntP family protein [bacterium]